jgi:hypothetical protein
VNTAEAIPAASVPKIEVEAAVFPFQQITAARPEQAPAAIITKMNRHFRIISFRLSDKRFL